MDSLVNNNIMEVEPSPRHKRKRDCHNVYMNPALDLLATNDTICNNMMEIVPNKKRKRSRSCDARIAFENEALEAINTPYDFKRFVKTQDNLAVIDECNDESTSLQNCNDDEVIMEQKSLRFGRSLVESTPIGTTTSPADQNISQQTSFNLSFIEKIEIDNDGEALYLDDDLNESNIMEIKTITTLSRNIKKTEVPKKKNTNPFLESYTECDVLPQPTSVDFPFDIPVAANPSDTPDESIVISSYEDTSSQDENFQENNVLARRLFDNDSIQYADDSSITEVLSPEIQRVNFKFTSNMVTHEPFVFGNNTLDKQSKILGCDVRNMSRNDIFNMESCKPEIEEIAKSNVPCEKVYETKSKKVSSKILNKIKDVFKHNKKPSGFPVSASNPYEVVRKSFREKKSTAPLACFENPALNLNTQDNNDVEIDCAFKNRRGFNLTPMKRSMEKENFYDSDCIDLSDYSCNPSIVNRKHVRFDTTLNHEKIITGNSFDSGKDVVVNVIRSNRPLEYLNIDHLDSKIDEYHNELENCFNEKKFISQHL